MKLKEVICKVCENKKSKQKFVTIPRKAYSIKPGDYVRITKIDTAII